MYSKRVINISVFILAFIIFLIFIFVETRNKKEVPQIEKNEEIITNEETEEPEEEIENTDEKENFEIIENWRIEIPSVSIIANINEGTDMSTLNKSAGHFNDTPFSDGNVCLAAHNRGFNTNYFGPLKDVKIGDKIIYTYEEIQRNYIITTNIEIDDTDWTYLENTKDNRITLITCVENNPQKRRCVQAVEIVEDKTEIDSSEETIENLIENNEVEFENTNEDIM